MEHRFLAILLTVALLLGMLTVGVGADTYTTTGGTCYLDDSPNTEMYLVTDQAYSDYVYYGAKNEPSGGVYYGRVCEGGFVDGTWGVLNEAENADESAVSFYTYVGDPYSLEYWSFLYGENTADGEHVLLINLNFNNEAADCPDVIGGTYDDKLIEDFRWLSTLSYPVFLRIGAEVNVWSNMPDAGTYIEAYQHIAALVREYAPNVALVFSPNCSSTFGTDMDSFYPGDDYVDWIGASLYYNRYANNGDETGDAFYGVNTYADAVLKLQQIIHLSDLHSKPVMITEGGSACYQQGTDTSAFAAEKVYRAYSYLTMVYPQLKCLIYSDTDFHSDTASYFIYNNDEITTAYDAAVAANPTLVHSCSDSADYYTKVSAYTGDWSGTMQLTAYTWSQKQLTASWYVDDAWAADAAELPYTFTLDADSLGEGDHSIEVRFSNGESKRYLFTIGEGSPFMDVRDPALYYYDAVLWAVNAGITSGTSDTMFSPEESCTRSQFVTFLWRAAGEPEPQNTYCPFTDVNPDDFYYDAMLWAVDNGIVYGTSDTSFSPETPCTRAEALTLLYRADGSPDFLNSVIPFKDFTSALDRLHHGNGGSLVSELLNPFTDVSRDDYYYDAVCWAVASGITSGTTDTTFSPDEECSRGQTVTFLYRDRT